MTSVARDTARNVLATTIAMMAGPDARPRAEQITAVEELVDRHRHVLVVQATGWGKSAVYWAATAALRQQGAGPTLVVSPLLALMRDQISAAEKAGLRAATVNSTNIDQWAQVLGDVRTGQLDVLLISPERLSNPAFAAGLPDLLASVGMLVIDEAHCVSDWGFDFRPDYQRLTRTLLALAPGTPVLATTATANERVTADVAAQLGEDTVTLRGSLARASLRLAVVPQLSVLERYAWVADALRTLPGSGIIYVLTVAETERVAAFLTEQGFDVAAYSGQTTNREELEDRLRANQVKALVATSALGMGYDKPDLAFCVHLGSPGSPVAYYQQVGRAGRALDDALAVLVPAESDERIWQYFATAGIPDEHQVEQILDALGDAPQSLPALESATGIRRGRLESTLKILAVDDAVKRQSGGWVATGTAWYFDEAKWAALRRVRAAEADLMRSYAHGEGCLMQFLQQALDDPDPQPCGRCSVCTGQLPEPGERPGADVVAAAQRFFRGQDVVVEPRKLWPSGLPGRKGRIGFLAEGRALAFADDPAWAEELARMWQRDGAAPPHVLDGMVEVLKRWSKTWQRPVAVVAMPSRSYPTLVGSVAEHLSRIGRLPLVEALAVSGPRPAEDSSSSVRAGDLLRTTTLMPGMSFDGPVLLVDDRIRSRWTITVAGSLLAEAGATSVLPLALHQLP
ncbi:RecQ family ATP-dependent DNA helicase [uncultured Friedmanniella sp.]|uniref:RecQ family ATP-dependent DNA helicase n=1 Tax=uncultured Friedmanniella sp. TaxID=335381 RepID=UPI0035CA0C96